MVMFFLMIDKWLVPSNIVNSILSSKSVGSSTSSPSSSSSSSSVSTSNMIDSKLPINTNSQNQESCENYG